MGLSSKNTELDVEANIDHQWPFDDGEFDIVFGSHVMEHAKDPCHFIRQAFRVLKPGGTLRMNVPDAKWLCGRYMEKKKSLFELIRNLRSWHGSPEHKAHWHPFDKATILALFGHGFDPMLGIEPTVQSLDVPTTLFKDVRMCDPQESREEIMKAGYFSTRYRRTIRCEGTKP